MARYSTPANLQDLSAAGQTEWSNTVASFLNSIQNKPYFFEPFAIPAGQVGVSKIIPWNAYPRKYTLQFPGPNKFQHTENPVTADLGGRNYDGVYFNDRLLQNGVTDFLFRDQDEYLEWKTYRRADGSLSRVVFSCENPEYWDTIASDSDLLLRLYRQLVDPSVLPQELVFNRDVFVETSQGPLNIRGRYNPFNKWNTTHGIVHLSHPANYLSAEIQLGADATVIRRRPNGTVITDSDELIRCSRYGSAVRSSDPKIGSDINSIVRTGLSASISDPVGLYIYEVNQNAFTFPAGVSFNDCWRVVRGDAPNKRVVRASFDVPATINASQIKVSGRALEFGGQIAEQITMAIFGLGFNFGLGAQLPSACPANVSPLVASMSPKMMEAAKSTEAKMLETKPTISLPHR